MATPDPEQLQETLRRMREIRDALEDDESPQRRVRVKQADRRIARLEQQLADLGIVVERDAGEPVGDEEE
jgi:hypothetical protein